MNARNLLNLGLAVALLGLGGWIWFAQQAAPQADVVRLTPLASDDIRRIEIQPARRADAILERRGDDWWLVEPFEIRAAPTRVKAVMDLLQARSQAHYAAAVVDLEQAGLQSPDLRLRVDTLQLDFGDTEPLKGRRFVRVGDEVHLIVDRYSYLLQGGVASLVSPALLPSGALLREIRLPGRRLLQQDGRWRLAGGATTGTDSLQALVDEWQQAMALKVSRYDAAPASDAADVIELLFSNNGPLRFRLVQNDDETLLIREDLGLTYHFTPSAAARLLQLPVAGGEADDA